MKTRPVLLFVSVFAALVCWLQGSGQAAPGSSSDIVPDEVLVGMRAGHDTSAAVNRVTSAVGGRVWGSHAALHSYRLKVPRGLAVADAVAQLQQNPDVLYAEPNVILHTQATPSDLSYLNQYGPQRTQTDLAWDQWMPKAQVVIAVVDTGIDYTHPDLVNKIYRDAGGNIIGYNATGANAHSGVGTDPIDDMGHGTHCAGIAAAEINNGIGIAGIAGWSSQTGGASTTSTKLMPVKVMDSTGSGSTSVVASGITWAADHGAKVISLSLGGGGTTTMANAVQYAWNKGCVVVAAAGNSSSSTVSYPGGYPNVISVAATDSTDTLAPYSNYGSWVTVAAPGSGIYSTTPTYTAGGGYALNYAALSGTSMATPHVAGEAALLAAQNPTLTNAQIRSLIVASVDPFTPYLGRTIAATSGRINVYRAVLGATPVTLPAAPSNLTAAPGDAQVALSWPFVGGATSYNVKRATTSGGPYTTVAAVSTPGYTNTGLTNGATYYYVVTAVNAAGESGASNQVSAAPQALPAAPTGLAATAGNAQVSLTWTASSGATSYNVKRGTVSGGPYTTVGSSSTPSFTNTGLTNGATYYYVVTAVSAAGQSGNSNEASATPIAVPAAPTALAATPGNAQVSLLCTPSTGATSYNVKRATASGGPYVTVGSTATGAYLDTNVTNGKAYYYVVTALNAAGESGNSNEAFATPTAPAPTGAATFITTDAATAGSWTGTYGAGGYMIAGDATKLPAYAQASITTGDPYTWLASTNVTQALQKSSNPADRIAATWYSYNAVSLDLNLTDGKPHQVALYFMDWGNWGLVQNVEIRDAGSGALLSSQSVSSFRDGKYLVWSITGHVTIRCLLAGGPQVVLQGLFLDGGAASSTSAAATFVNTDAATAGNWIGTYGAAGYTIAGDRTSLPAYAQASITTGDPYTWLASTDVMQALQKSSNPADRIAATWYRYDAVSLDLNLTDGKPHQIALYFMDWGNWGLVQNVEIRDAGSGALLSSQSVSSFRDGKYLVWSITGHVTIRCLLAGGPQVVLQGLFID